MKKWLELLLLLLLPFLFVVQACLWVLLLPLCFSTQCRERLGWSSRVAPGALWLHGASLGEWNVLRALRENGLNQRWLGTYTSRNAARLNLADGSVDMRYLPLDLWPAVLLRFLRWRPGALLIAEVDLWPTLLIMVRLFSIPLIWVNGRSDRSMGRLIGSLHYLPRWLLGKARIAHCVDVPTAELWQQAGIDCAAAGMNLKWAVLKGKTTGTADPSGSEDKTWAEKIGGRTAVMLASVHLDERQLLRAAAAWAQSAADERCLIVAPRHLEEVSRIAMETTGAKDTSGSILFVREYGILDQLYPLCFAAVIGGTFDGIGGHNPVEPALFGCHILTGPDVHSQRPGMDLLRAAGNLYPLADPGLIGHTLAALPHSRFATEQLEQWLHTARADATAIVHEITKVLAENSHGTRLTHNR